MPNARHRPLLANSGHLVATSRALLAVLLFQLSMFDPEHVGFVHEPDDLFFLGYAAIVLAALFIALNSWWWAFRMLPALYAIDWLVFIASPFLVEPLISEHTAIAVVMTTFIAYESGEKWGQKGLVASALLLNAAFCATSWIIAAGDGNFQFNEYFRRIVFVALASIIVVWNGLSRPAAAMAGPIAGYAGDREAVLANALSFAMRRLGASGGAICWSGTDGSPCLAVSAGTLADPPTDRGRCASACDCPLPCLTPIDSGAAGRLIDMRRDRSLAISPLGEVSQIKGTIPEHAALAPFGVSSGLYLLLAGKSGSGGLLLTGMPAPSWSCLVSGLDLARAVAQVIDDHAHVQAANSVAMDQLRHAIARDLHDSIAQSLAGARFWLHGLSRKFDEGSPTALEIGRIRDALAAEHESLRTMIARLQSDEAPPATVDIARELETLCGFLSLHWRVAVHLTDGGQPIVASSALAHAVQQITREAVSNAVRHGDARCIELAVAIEQEWLRLTIVDDGKGFGPDALDAPLSLDSRARSLGGDLLVRSEPGRTALEFLLPFGR